MQNLTRFLERAQTFNIQLIKRVEIADLIASKTKNGTDAYWLGQESAYWEYSNFKSEMRILRDMALIDIISLAPYQQKRALSELRKVLQRFHVFWKLYHMNFDDDGKDYNNGFISSIRLAELFLVHGYFPEQDDIFIGVDFVESLSDSVKLREKMLNKLITEVEGIIALKEVVEVENPDIQDNKPFAVKSGTPKFTDGTANSLLNIISPYFPEEQITDLEGLFLKNDKPQCLLIFHGNGNQLADAFKQLFEANLVVGCKKNELEKWLADHFVYLYKNITKEYTEGYLNGIISSDAKPCKSPILEVRKKDDKYVIVSTLRNKKNTKF